jgi:hypothetical protein
MTVTLDNVDFTAPSLEELRSIGLFTDESQLPWTVSLRDLMVICDLCESPAQLIHYLRRRLRVYDYKKFTAQDELGYFGFYLLSGLDFGSWNLAEPDHILISNFTDDIDRYYLHKQGLRSVPTEKPRWAIPDLLKTILRELQRIKQPGWIEASCILLDVPASSMNMVFKVWQRKRRDVAKDGMLRGWSYILPSRATGITIYVGGRGPRENDVRVMTSYAMLRKYQSKANSWIGILEMIGTPSLAFYFDREPWDEDVELARLVESQLGSSPLPDTGGDA